MAECQRSVLSCSRCRKRKTKCDRKLPACSSCVQARATCTGFSGAVSAAEVPRSIVRHLEFEIARLETELAKGGHLDTLNASDILAQMPSGNRSAPALFDFNEPVTRPTLKARDNELAASIMRSKEVQSMISATLPRGFGLTDLVSRVRMGLTPSSTSGVANASQQQRSSVSPKTTAQQMQIETRVLSSMPKDIVQSLVRKYIQWVLPQYPFLLEPVIWQQFDAVMGVLHSQEQYPTSPGSRSVQPNHDFFVVYVLLAISVTLGSAKGGHESRCMSLSASLFEEGIQHFSGQMRVPSDLAGLQMNLLILLYATVNPRSANVWILSGAAMRSCLELGLHREYPEEAVSDPQGVDLRRRIFWSAYCMDRSICSALQRPLSIPDAAINTEFPSGFRSSLVAADTPSPALGLIYYHRLQSEILQVHFQGQPLPEGMQWEDWLGAMEQKLRVWYEESCKESGNNELVEFALARGLTILHRPSPRTPTPSQRSLLIAFEAASSSARSHHEHIVSGFFRRPWISAHHTLETAMIVIFCLRHGCEHISRKFSSGQIFEMTKLFTRNFLAIASQGWSEVSKYAGVYERLLGPLLETVFSPNKNPQDHFGPAQDAELTRLLYPGPAHLDKLRFGTRHEEDFSAFDFSVFNLEDDFLELGNMPLATNGMMDFIPASELLDRALGGDEYDPIF